MNADGAKPEVAHAQTYFAIQTRKQEQAHSALALEQRLELRELVRGANKDLNETAQQAGVVRFGVFHAAGYKGLYGDLGNTDVKGYKGIPSKEDLLDCIGHTELAANYFRITQAQEKLVKTRVQTEREAVNTHYNVGREVRDAMERISGVLPEDLPAEPSIKGLKKPPSGGLLDE
jgi:DNA-damage-inducible protein D